MCHDDNLTQSATCGEAFLWVLRLQTPSTILFVREFELVALLPQTFRCGTGCEFRVDWRDCAVAAGRARNSDKVPLV